MPSITNGILTASFSISDKNASGQFTISATITNTDSSTRALGNPRLSCSLNGSSNWQQIGTSSLNAGASYSGSTTFSTGSTSDGIVYCYLLTDNLSGIGDSYSVSGYVDPTPEMQPKSISVSPSSQIMGQEVSVNEYGGYYAVVSDRQVLLNGQTVGNYSSGTWVPDISDFEPLSPNSNSLTVQLRARCTAASGATGSGYSNTVNLELTVPDYYIPVCSHSAEILNSVNGAIIGGQSGLEITINPGLSPADNSATIANYELYNIVPVPTYDTIPVQISNFVNSGYKYTCTELPLKSGVPSYQFKLVFRITDSRGNIADYETEAYRVSSFVSPLVQITNLDRSSSTSGTLELTIDGESTAHPSRIVIGDESLVQHTMANVIVDDGTLASSYNVKSNLVQTGKGYTLNYSISGLVSGKQYNISFVYRDSTMVSYGESYYTYTALLSTMAMPISLYDNGSRMAVSFGEECANNYGQDCVINFAKDSYIRYVKDNIVQLVKAEIAFGGGSCPYRVGDIYITTLSTDPSDIWEGTYWEQIEDKFLLSAGAEYTAGNTGGEAEHILTIAEMPSHSHDVTIPHTRRSVTTGSDADIVDDNTSTTFTTTTVGGGEAHNNMPPYLVVYIWKRVEEPVTYSFTVRDYGSFNYTGPSTWSDFVSSTDNPTLSGQDKRFKIETSATLGNVVQIGRLVSGVATYDRYIYSSQETIINSSSGIINGSTYNAETGEIVFDYVLENDFDEVDILYTTDTHLRWLGNAGSDYTYSPVFSLQNVADYKDLLWDNDIPAFCVDCGDWVHGSTTTTALQNEIIGFFNNCGLRGLTKYLSVTYGNHEWYAAVGSTAAECIANLNRVNNMTACNLLSNGNEVYKGYRAVKVGSKRVGIINVGYPSANGRGSLSTDTWTFDGYTFLDSQQTTASNPNSALYVKVQSIINKMRASDFDYIIATTHMDKYADEDFTDDSRFNSRADFLIENTDGIDLVIPGHYNYEIDQTFTKTGTGGHQGVIVQEAGASLHSFGRIKLKFDGTAPQSYLLKTQSDLEEI